MVYHADECATVFFVRKLPTTTFACSKRRGYRVCRRDGRAMAHDSCEQKYILARPARVPAAGVEETYCTWTTLQWPFGRKAVRWAYGDRWRICMRSRERL